MTEVNQEGRVERAVARRMNTTPQRIPAALRARGAHAPPDWRSAMSITDEPRKRHRCNLKPPEKGCPSKNKGKKFPPHALTRDEVLALLGCTREHTVTGKRNYALIVVLWRAGLRVAEACALEMADVDLERGTIHVRCGKGAKSRLVGIDPDAIEKIRAWMDARAKLGVPRLSPLFCCTAADRRGAPIKTAYVRQMLHRLASAAGVEKRVHPHCLRHTMASELADEGTDIRVISGQLGHSNIAITDRYVSHLNPTAVLRTMAMRGGWGGAA